MALSRAHTFSKAAWRLLLLNERRIARILWCAVWRCPT